MRQKYRNRTFIFSNFIYNLAVGWTKCTIALTVGLGRLLVVILQHITQRKQTFLLKNFKRLLSTAQPVSLSLGRK
jgi:hypothetical protein